MRILILKYRYLFYLFFACATLTAQNNLILPDSFKANPQPSVDATHRFGHIKQWGESYWTRKPDSAITIFQAAQEEALAQKNDQWYFEFVTEEGCTNQFYKSESVRALELFLKALRLAESLGDQKKICRCNFLISSAHLKNKTWDKAEEYLKKTIECKRQLADWSLYFTSLKNLGVFYLQRGKPDVAESILSQAKKELEAFPNDRYNWVLTHIRLIEVKYELGKMDEAIALCEALEKYGLHDSQVDPTSLAIFYLTQSRIANHSPNWKNYKKALAYAEKAIQIDTQVLSDKMINARAKLNKARALFELGKNTEGYNLMARTYEEINVLKDARFEYLLKEKTSKMQSEYDLEQKHKIEQKLIGEISDQLFFLILCAFLLLMTTFFAIAVARNYRIEKLGNKILNEKNQEIIKQKEEIELKNRQLVQLNTAKDKLFSIIGHDLRSPIGSVKSTLGLLNDEIIAPEDFKRIAIRLEKDVENTYNLLEELLEWSFTQMRGFEPQKALLDLEALIEEKIELFKPRMESKNISFSLLTHDDINVVADKSQLGIVLSNLLSNAIKFTPEGGRIAVESAKIENSIRMSVIDTGIGIPADCVGGLFDRDFVLQRKGTAGEKSTGLGLILCKEIVEKNNGQISVESVVGKGTTVTILLPKNTS